MAKFKYNTGHIHRPNFADGTFGRVRNSIWSLPNLSEPARLLLAWVDGRPPDWIPIVKFICKELRWGKDKWRRVRDELENKGWLYHSHVRTSEHRTDHLLKFDLSQLALVAQDPHIARDTRIEPTSRRNSSPSRDAPSTCPLKQEEINRKKKTTTEGENKPAAPCRGVDDEIRSEGLNARPLVATTGTVGSRLAVLLGAQEVGKVNEASVGLSDKQAEAVVMEVFRHVNAGKVRSPVGLSIALSRAAARGEFVADEMERVALTTASNSEAVWQRRAEHVGWSVLHPTCGRLTVEAEAKAWRNEDGQLIAGQNGLKLWDKVERGLIVLHEPLVRGDRT